MRKFKKYIFFLLLVLIFVELLIIIPKRIQKNQNNEIIDTAQKLANQTQLSKVDGIHIVESKKGGMDWELFSKSAEGTQNSGTWKLSDMKVQYYTKDKVEFIVDGKTGSVDGMTKDMDIRGDVVTQSANGYVFKSQTVVYQSAKRVIVSNDPVTMMGPQDK